MKKCMDIIIKGRRSVGGPTLSVYSKISIGLDFLFIPYQLMPYPFPHSLTISFLVVQLVFNSDIHTFFSLGLHHSRIMNIKIQQKRVYIILSVMDF